MDSIGGLVASILTAIIGVAILSVLVSQNSNTTGVIQAITSGFGSILSVAVSPVSGGGSGGGSNFNMNG